MEYCPFIPFIPFIRLYIFTYPHQNKPKTNGLFLCAQTRKCPHRTATLRGICLLLLVKYAGPRLLVSTNTIRARNLCGYLSIRPSPPSPPYFNVAPFLTPSPLLPSSFSFFLLPSLFFIFHHHLSSASQTTQSILFIGFLISIRSLSVRHGIGILNMTSPSPDALLQLPVEIILGIVRQLDWQPGDIGSLLGSSKTTRFILKSHEEHLSQQFTSHLYTPSSLDPILASTIPPQPILTPPSTAASQPKRTRPQKFTPRSASPTPTPGPPKSTNGTQSSASSPPVPSSLSRPRASSPSSRHPPVSAPTATTGGSRRLKAMV
ncbi:hypothetical protein GMDG_00538 [Pseudogymnoascus destructans 20631-21]|uniref:F-box domain-containing protein n=1 Tax=Pseudogymnoascus destructans (strain ATCC MYA-4855 / 20631-21) TaxID=658429 RepID=L8G6J9_PSED2|nr:hypothetical protein GMDG_00538 [Pseudogymnoascus destructans 20631-21]